MLSELELKIIDECKILRTGVIHMSIMLDFGKYRLNIDNGELPKKQELEEIFGMDFYRGFWVEFNATYLHDLPKKKVNPLQTEQEAWRLLSPVIWEYLDKIDVYLKKYSPKEFNETTKKEFLGYISRGNELLDKWQIICNSYKTKYQGDSDKDIAKTEKAARNLIQELSSKIQK